MEQCDFKLELADGTVAFCTREPGHEGSHTYEPLTIDVVAHHEALFKLTTDLQAAQRERDEARDANIKHCPECGVPGYWHISECSQGYADVALGKALSRVTELEAEADKIRGEALEEALVACEKVRAYGAVKTIARAMEAITKLKP